MAYQALYRKWRPQTFDDVIGQNHIVSTLKNEILSGKTAHAYLFCGTRGTGKTSCAKIFARAINCENPQNANPCNECDICRGVAAGSILDIVEIDAASNNGVDSIREIRDEVAYSAAQAKYKIYIIDEAHMLSSGAVNALLKTLEEPPPYVIFILATTEAHKLLPTITSRCQRFDFKRIGVRDITLRLREIVTAENVDAEIEALELIARLADGGMRDALSVLDQCISAAGTTITRESVESVLGVAADTVLDDIVTAIGEKNTGAALELLAQTAANGKDLTNFTDRVIQRFRDILVLGTCKQPDKLFDCGADVLDTVKKQSKLFTPAQLAYCIDTLTAAVGNAKNAKSVRVVYELALIRLCDTNFDASTAGLLARIEQLEGRLAGTVTAPVAPPVIPAAPAAPIAPAEPKPVAPVAPATPEEAPPWTQAMPIEQAMPEDVPPPTEAPPQEAVPIEYSEPVPAPPKPKAAVNKSGAWGEILGALKKIDVALYGMLASQQVKIVDDSLYFKNISYIKFAVQNDEAKLQQAIAQVLGQNLRIKFATETEFDSLEEQVPATKPAEAEEADPLEALMQFGGDDISFE